jgi:hypothetical protein
MTALKTTLAIATAVAFATAALASTSAFAQEAPTKIHLARAKTAMFAPMPFKNDYLDKGKACVAGLVVVHAQCTIDGRFR